MSLKVEGKALDIECLDAYVQREVASRRVRYLSLDASERFLVLGASSGSLYFYDRESLDLRLVLPLAELTGIPASPITHVRLRSVSNDDLLAVATRGGDVCVILHGLSPTVANSPSFVLRTTSHSDRKAEVTCMAWSSDGGILFSGDSLGGVVATRVYSVSSKQGRVPFKASSSIALRWTLETLHEVSAKTFDGRSSSKSRELSVLMHVFDSPVVQLDCSDPLVLASSLRNAVLIDVTREREGSVRVAPIGKTLRDGEYGGCFCRSAGRTDLYVSRPGNRLWLVDSANGSVISTLNFRSSLSSPPTSFPSSEPVTLSAQPPTFNFSRLTGVRVGSLSESQYIVSWGESVLYFLVPSSVRVEEWHVDVPFVRCLVEVGGNLYLLHGPQPSVSVIIAVDIDRCLLDLVGQRRSLMCVSLAVRYSTRDCGILNKISKLVYGKEEGSVLTAVDDERASSSLGIPLNVMASFRSLLDEAGRMRAARALKEREDAVKRIGEEGEDAGVAAAPVGEAAVEADVVSQQIDEGHGGQRSDLDRLLQSGQVASPVSELDGSKDIVRLAEPTGLDDRSARNLSEHVPSDSVVDADEPVSAKVATDGERVGERPLLLKRKKKKSRMPNIQPPSPKAAKAKAKAGEIVGPGTTQGPRKGSKPEGPLRPSDFFGRGFDLLGRSLGSAAPALQGKAGHVRIPQASEASHPIPFAFEESVDDTEFVVPASADTDRDFCAETPNILEDIISGSFEQRSVTEPDVGIPMGIPPKELGGASESVPIDGRGPDERALGQEDLDELVEHKNSPEKSSLSDFDSRAQRIDPQSTTEHSQSPEGKGDSRAMVKTPAPNGAAADVLGELSSLADSTATSVVRSDEVLSQFVSSAFPLFFTEAQPLSVPPHPVRIAYPPRALTDRALRALSAVRSGVPAFVSVRPVLRVWLNAFSIEFGSRRSAVPFTPPSSSDMELFTACFEFQTSDDHVVGRDGQPGGKSWSQADAMRFLHRYFHMLNVREVLYICNVLHYRQCLEYAVRVSHLLMAQSVQYQGVLARFRELCFNAPAKALAMCERPAVQASSLIPAASLCFSEEVDLVLLLLGLPVLLEKAFQHTMEFCVRHYPGVQPWNLEKLLRDKTPELFLRYLDLLMEEHEDCRNDRVLVCLWFECLLQHGAPPHSFLFKDGRDSLHLSVARNAHLQKWEHESALRRIICYDSSYSSNPVHLQLLCSKHGYVWGLVALCLKLNVQRKMIDVIVMSDDDASFEIAVEHSLQDFDWAHLIEKIEEVTVADETLDQPPEPPRRLEANYVARRLVAIVGVYRCLELLRAYPAFAARLSPSAYPALCQRNILDIENRWAFLDILKKVDEHLWAKKFPGLSPQVLLLKDFEARRQANRLPFVLQKGAGGAGGTYGDFEVAFEHRVPIRRSFEESSGHWGSKVDFGVSCGVCSLPLAEAVGRNIIVLPCRHAFHQHCLPEEACVVCVQRNMKTLHRLAEFA